RQRRPVHGGPLVGGGHVRGDDVHLLGDPPVGGGDAGRGGTGQRAGHPGDHGHRDAGRGAGRRLLPASAEHEGVAALEPDHEPAGPGALDEQPVDLLLGHRPPVGDLGGVDDLHVGGEPVEQRGGGEPVHHHHVGLGEQLAAAHGDQAGVAGAAAHQRDAAQRLAAAARVQGAVAEPVDHGVAQPGGAARVAVGDDAHGRPGGGAGGRGPGGGGVPVVGADAPDPGGLGLGGDGGVHLGVVGGAVHQPEVAEG